MDKLKELRKKLEAIQARMSDISKMPADGMTDVLRTEVSTLIDESKVLRADVEREEKFEAEMRAVDASMKTPVDPVVPSETEDPEKPEKRKADAKKEKVLDPSDGSAEIGAEYRKKTPHGTEIVVVRHEKPFKNFGEQLQAVAFVADGTNARSELGRKLMDKLINITEEVRAATGVSAKVDADSGFAIQTESAGMLMESVVREDPFLNMVDTYNLGPESDSVKWIEPDESDVSTTVFGGVQVYRAAEAETVTATKAQLREHRIELEKLMGLAYVTGETMKNTTFMSQLMERSFSLAMRRKLGAEVISGTGVGMCRGILAGDGLITQAVETGQDSSNPILYANIVRMWNRMMPDSRNNSVWLCSPDIEAELMFTDFPVGTGGAPVFMPPGGGIGPAVTSLYQRPVLVTDNCSALNALGDIILVDPAQYMLLLKGGVESSTSIHVRYLFDEQVFRFIYYSNGMPKKSTAITLANSTTTRGYYVTLAARPAP